MVVSPFISLTEDGNYYVVLMDAPGLCPSNVEITLNGRELVIASHTVTSNVPSSAVVQITTVWERRIRFPGPVLSTGPPSSEFHAPGRLRISMQKADAPPSTEDGLSLL